ncbi:MAG TPA: membrane protein insertase YidC, partial [Gemmatimonadales bacterium]|nr:membrane protein insertase YidC [Gemmatimonadales bacterium]
RPEPAGPPVQQPADTLPARPPERRTVPETRSPADRPAASVPEDTIVVSSPKYRYAISTLGARVIEATFPGYPSMRPDERGQPTQILHPDGDLLELGLLVGTDTLSFRDWRFAPSTPSLEVNAQAQLGLTAREGGVVVSVNFTFRPDEYLFDVAGQVQGLGSEGGALLVGLGPGLRNVEADSGEHQRELGVVVKQAKADLTRFRSLEPGQPAMFGGPFEWVAVKSKYFVTAVLALDTTSTGGGRLGGISGATALTTDVLHKDPTTATITLGLPIPASGLFRYQVYAGPLEYSKLRAIGHDFDDVNPYGWPGFRTIIRPVAVGARSLLVWLHDGLGLAYGMGLVIFGVVIRILLWPLNQKAMRSTMAMQVVQPLIKELQEKHKGDPQKLQQEMFRLYKEHKVNPFGGCWPMLLPWPILIALFFVFQNTIELRGAPFLWIPDLSRPDPLYVIPILMGLSMFVLTWIGQRGLPPNPQTKMMMYLMPGVMTFLFLRFASGLNLYYAVMNVASLPQQWLLARERQRRGVVAPTPPPPAPPTPSPKKKRK